MVETERVAYCDYAFAGHDVGRIAKPGGRQIGRAVNFQHGKVKAGVAAFYPGGKFASVLQVNHYLIAGHNMGIRQHKAILAVNDYARTQAAALSGLAFAAKGIKIGPGAEKTLQRRKVFAGNIERACNVDHRRCHAFYSPDHGRHARAVFACRECWRGK